MLTLQLGKLRLGAVRPGPKVYAEEVEGDSNPGLDNWAAERIQQGHSYLLPPYLAHKLTGLVPPGSRPRPLAVPFSGFFPLSSV